MAAIELRVDPSARVEPLKPEAKVVRTRGHAYLPIKTAWLATCIGTLVALGLVFRNLQAVQASAAVNKQIEKVPSVMRNQEAEMADLRGPHVLGSMTSCKNKYQMPLAAEAQQVFIIAIPEDLFTPTGVLQGVLNEIAYF